MTEPTGGAPGTATSPGWTLGMALAEALPRLYGVERDPLVEELILALALAVQRGELELPLAGSAPEGIGAESLAAGLWPEGHRAALERSPLLDVGREPAQAGPAPLVCTAAGGLAWRRWRDQLDDVLAQLRQRALSPLEPALPLEHRLRLRDVACRRGELDAQQARAVEALLSQRLVLLGGGPGTGKTTTVVQMLAAALEARPDLRVHLAAPTGKAATRLRQAERCMALPCTTLHRLLESRGDGFARNRRHPLALDLLVIDEVSMLDLALMAAVLDALPQQAQLLLVGDPAQLPPVSPGAVLIALEDDHRRASLGDAMVQLATPYRNEGAIATVAAQLRNGAGARLQRSLAALAPRDNLHWLRCEPPRLPEAPLERLHAHQERLGALAAAFDPSQPATAQALLNELEACVLLTPVRSGSWGVEALHRRLLGEAAERGAACWPLGTPVLCSRNLAEQNLANGDVGVVVRQGRDTLLLFGDDTTGPRLLHPARLPGAEPALALTIHKSQGSQYQEVVVLLPRSERWDGRLLYTALTRARREAWLVTPPMPPWAPAPGP
jgi:exodeoxyribonuclease V alpha subunit